MRKKLAIGLINLLFTIVVFGQTDLEVTGSGDRSRLSWSITGTPPTSFIIERRVNNGSWEVIESNYVMPEPYPQYKFTGINRNFYYIDLGLITGSSYQYRINGNESNSITLRGTVYYVKNGGNDNADGLSDATAWATLERANRSRVPGNLILFRRGDTFSVNYSLRLDGMGDGTQENPIKWSAYGTGEKPVINLFSEYGLQIRDISHWVFEELRLGGSTTGIVRIGAYTRNVNNIKFLNCYIDGSSLTGGFGGGIYMYEQNASSNHTSTYFIDNVEIAYSELKDVKPFMAAIRAWACRSGGHYHNNYFSNNQAAIVVSGGLNHCVEYNEIKAGTYSNPVNKGSKANSQQHLLENMIYRHNLIYNCGEFGLQLEASKNGLVEFNTVFNSTGGYGSCRLSAPQWASNTMGNIVRNNIFVGSRTGEGAARVDTDQVGEDWLSKFDWDNNLVYETSGYIVKFHNNAGHSNINSGTQWQSQWLPNHPNDVHADPLFIDAVNEDFRLQTNSPAGNRGYSAGISIEANKLPVLSSIGTQYSVEMDTTVISLSATDADGDALSFSISPQLDFIRLIDNQDGTGELVITPDAGQSGSYNLRVSVTDENNGKDSETFILNINEDNQSNNLSPTLAFIGNHRIDENSILTLQLSSNDPENDNLTYSIYPGNINFINLTDNLNGTASLTISPISGDVGIYSITVVVTDEFQNSDSEKITIVVDKSDNGNTIPFLNPMEDQIVNVGEVKEIILTAGDADGDELSFFISTSLDFITLIDNHDGTALLKIFPGNDDGGNYDIQILVTDNNNGNDVKGFNLIINDGSGIDYSNIINSGGGSVESGSGGLSIFHADDYYTGGSTADRGENYKIANTENDALYRSVRYGDFNYDIPVPQNGFYTVRLHFAEVTFTAGEIGKRVFNVKIENEQENLLNYDINADVGPKTAAVKTFTDIYVEDNKITIDLETVVQNAMISGIEIISEINFVTHLDSEILNKKYTIYPNPSDGVFNVDLPLNNPPSRAIPYRIYNTIGNIIYESKIDGINTRINLSGIKSGLYIINIDGFPPERILIR